MGQEEMQDVSMNLGWQSVSPAPSASALQDVPHCTHEGLHIWHEWGLV